MANVCRSVLPGRHGLKRSDGFRAGHRSAFRPNIRGRIAASSAPPLLAFVYRPGGNVAAVAVLEYWSAAWFVGRFRSRRVPLQLLAHAVQSAGDVSQACTLALAVIDSL